MTDAQTTSQYWMDFICDTTKPKNFNELAKNPHMTCDMFKQIIRLYRDKLPHEYVRKIAYHPSMSFSDLMVMGTLYGGGDLYGYWDIVIAHPNTTWDDISANPDIDWVYSKFFENPNFSWDVVHKNPQIHWKSIYTVESKYINFDDMIQHLDTITYPGDYTVWGYISARDDINFEYVLANPDKPWNWRSLTINKAITAQHIEHHPDLSWDPIYIFMKDLSWDFMKHRYYEILNSNERYSKRDYEAYDNIPKWVASLIIRNPNVTWDIIKSDPNLMKYLDIVSWSDKNTWENVEEHVDLDWDWIGISTRKPIRIDKIKAHCTQDLNWYYISKHAHWNDIVKHPELPWDWSTVSYNKSVTWDVALANPEKPWDYYSMSFNKSITWANIKMALDKPWHWSHVSSNCASLDDITENIELNWDWTAISGRDDLSWDFIHAHPTKPWDWAKLCERSIT